MPAVKLASVALAFLLLAAACSSGAATPTATVAPTAPPPTKAPISSPTSPPRLAPPSTPTPTPFVALPQLGDVAFDYVRVLVDEVGPRESATEAELLAAEYISGKLQEMGYEVEMQDFIVEKYLRDRPWVIMTAPAEETIDSRFLNLTGTGEVAAPIVAVGLGTKEEFPLEGLNGKIALILRGGFSFEEKVQNAQEAGASAAIIYNNEPDHFLGTLATQGQIPALSITQADGERLLEFLAQGEVVLDIKLLRQPSDSHNVVATKPGTRSAVIVVGAHMDTVADAVGANDNASGIGVLLTVAQELKDKELPVTVKFIAFGSEELGLLGSFNYVRAFLIGEVATMVAMINLDTVGSGGSLVVGGEQGLVTDALLVATQMGIDLSPGREPNGAASDHITFQLGGIDSVFFLGRDFSRIHTPEDTLEFVEPELLGDTANLTLGLIYRVAGH